MSLISPSIATGYSRIDTRNGAEESKGTWFDFQLGELKPPGHWPDGSQGVYGQHICSTRSTVGQSSVHRAHFLDMMVKLVPSTSASFGKRLVNLTTMTNPKKRVILEFQDGSTAEADAVIGCDGVKSMTRKVLLGEDHTKLEIAFSGKYAYRGLIPMPKATAILGAKLAQNSQQYLGKHGHILTFPVEKGSTMNVVAFRCAKTWEYKEWVLPVAKEKMFADFEGWGDVPMKILGMMEKPDIWGLFDHPPVDSYVGCGGRLCLLGDAAHATTPHQGAGAGQALEDAYILTSLLGDCESVEELEAAFRAYDVVRRPRSQKVVTTSRRVGGFYEFEDEEVGEDLGKLAETLKTWYNWIWDVDMVGELERARAVMKGEKASL